MAAAVYTSDLTDIVADSSNTANWAALGGGASGLNIETDYFIEGTRCVSKNAWAGAAKGMVEDTTNVALTSGDLDAVYTWVTHLTPGSLATKANGGIAVCMGSASNALNRYNYAGSDTIDYGAPWICAVVDPENATQSSGTVLPANINTYGAEANLPVGGPTKGAPFGIDEIRQGRSYEVTEGDSGAPATFTAAAAKNDLIGNKYGQFQGVPGITGAYTMQCRFSFGTATTACYFEDSGATVTINDLEFVDPDFQEFDVVNSSSVVKLTSSSFAAVGTNSKGNFKITSASSVDVTSCTFSNMGIFTLSSAATFLTSILRNCVQLIQNSATITDTIFDLPNVAVSTAAVESDDLELITGCTFNSAGTGHAIELTSIGDGGLLWDNKLSGYDAGVSGSPVTPTTTGDEAIWVNVASGTLTLTVSANATIPSIRSAGAIVNVVTGTVTVQAIITDLVTGLPLEGVRIHVTKDVGGAVVLEGVTDSNGIVQDTAYSYTVDEAISGRARFNQANVYKTGNLSGTITSTGLTMTQSLIADE
jgi:hypothetical protein